MTDDHGQTKYLRPIQGACGDRVLVDVYAVLEAFDVRCPARQHAVKKLLCAGLRGKGDALQDLKETQVAVVRAIELQETRQCSTPES